MYMAAQEKLDKGIIGEAVRQWCTRLYTSQNKRRTFWTQTASSV